MRATVVIPCYRPDANFEKMLDDLNAQTAQDFLVVLADDGNDDPIEPRVAARLTRPFHVIRFPENRGIVAGLNACVAHASTPYILRMDADDRMPPDRIARQLAFMDTHPDVDVAGAAMAAFGSGLRVWSKPTAHDAIRASLLWSPSLNHPTVIAKASVLKEHPYPDGFALAEDYALWLDLVTSGVRLANTTDIAVYYRMEGQNTSQTGNDKRARRYLEMFKHAVATLLGPESLARLQSGIDQGCHHVLAGMPLPDDVQRPQGHQVQVYAEALRAELDAIPDAWALAAKDEVALRWKRVSGKGRWHKLGPVFQLARLPWSAWRTLLSSGR